MVIYKYSLTNDFGAVSEIIRMPQGAHVLSAANQSDNIFVWALVDPENSLVPHRFLVVGTGHLYREYLSARSKFVDTVLLFSGTIVLHVFDEGEVC